MEEMKLYNYDELCKAAEEEERQAAEALAERDLVRLNMDHLEITLTPGHGYPIDLISINCGAELADWAYHLEQKVWYSPQLLHDFLSQFREAFELHFGVNLRGVKHDTWNWKTKTIHKHSIEDATDIESIVRYVTAGKYKRSTCTVGVGGQKCYEESPGPLLIIENDDLAKVELSLSVSQARELAAYLNSAADSWL